MNNDNNNNNNNFNKRLTAGSLKSDHQNGYNHKGANHNDYDHGDDLGRMIIMIKMEKSSG